MRLLLILAIFFCSQFVRAQSITNNLWNIGAYVSSSFNVYTIQKNIPTGDNTGINDFSRTKYNFAAGVENKFILTKKLDFVIGLAYSEMSFKGTSYCNTCDFGIQPLYQVIRQSYIQTPLFFRYHPLDKTIKVHFDTGISNSYSTNRFWHLQKFILNGRLGVGINHNLRKRKIYYTLTYRNSLGIISDYTNYKLQSLGLIIELQL